MMRLHKDDDQERIKKARDELRQRARELVENGEASTVEQARVEVARRNPELRDTLRDASPPGPEPMELTKAERDAREAFQKLKGHVDVAIDSGMSATEAWRYAINEYPALVRKSRV